MDIMSLPRVGPFVGVSWNKPVTFDDLPGRTFRLLIYGAYDAFGLIGSECNGIAVLDEEKLEVVCDEIEKISSGYFGPSQAQLDKLEELSKMSWDEFRTFINENPRSRHTYDEAGEIAEVFAAAGGR